MEAAQAGVSYWGPARELEVTRQPGTPLGLTIWGGTVDLGNRWADGYRMMIFPHPLLCLSSIY